MDKAAATVTDVAKPLNTPAPVSTVSPAYPSGPDAPTEARETARRPFVDPTPVGGGAPIVNIPGPQRGVAADTGTMEDRKPQTVPEVNITLAGEPSPSGDEVVRPGPRETDRVAPPGRAVSETTQPGIPQPPFTAPVTNSGPHEALPGSVKPAPAAEPDTEEQKPDSTTPG